MHQTQGIHTGVTQPPYFRMRRGEIDNCSHAEPRMLMAIHHPHYMQPGVPRMEQSVRIVTNSADEPLLIQKIVDTRRNPGINLGLSLQALHIGNVTWPAGTFMQVSSQHRVTEGTPVTVISADQVQSLGPLRMSAFALPADEREPFIIHGHYSFEVEKIVGSICMDEIRDRVAKLE